VFHTRCPRRLEGDICSTVEPPLTTTPDGGVMRCHIPFDQLGGQSGGRLDEQLVTIRRTDPS
jgi:hypothetical protein